MSSARAPERRALACAACIGLATAAAYLLTRLAWAPVPWPDGSAFYLPGLDLISWPPRWRMHAQAAFVPSYDEANFNIMPGLPALLGALGRSGLTRWLPPTYLIRIASVLGLLGWAWLLWSWLRELMAPKGAPPSTRAARYAAAIALAGLWDPIVRWGTLAVRTETWVGLCWVWVLRELSRWERAEEEAEAACAKKDGHRDTALAWPRIAWRIAAGLAMAAYFHFEAVYFVPATALGLGFRPGWFRRLLGIGARTTALLLPWVAYALWRFPLLVEQMRIQFYRLSHGNPWMDGPYRIFHSLFIEHGSPAGSPKFLNLAKGIFWALLAAALVGTVSAAWRSLRRDQSAGNAHAPSFARALTAAGIGFAATFYLWATKAEVWFVNLCHVAFWPWIGAMVGAMARTTTEAAGPSFPRRAAAVAGLAGAFAAISLLAAFGQARAISPGYTWERYGQWVDCIVRAAETNAPRSGALRFWQPGQPDVLVELSSRRPDWDVTRSLDFAARRDLALRAAENMDAVVLTWGLNPQGPEAEAAHEGELRAVDRERLARGSDVLFGPWALEALQAERRPGQPTWRARACEVGPFWSVVMTRATPAATALNHP